MKKKLTAVLCAVLIALLCVSLFACKDDMFDASFKEEATAEQAKAAWDAANEAINGSSARASLASGDETPVEGWSGIGFEVSSTRTVDASLGEDALAATGSMSASGALLFDMSGFSLSASADGSVNDKAISAKIGAYLKDKVYYSDITVNDADLQAKADMSNSSIVNVVNSALSEMLTTLSSAFAGLGLDYTASILSAIPYEELQALGLKSYINSSGDYDRVKFELPVELFAKLQGAGDDADFIKTLAKADLSLIIVTDKETGNFSGAKVDLEYAFKADISDAAAGTGAKLSMAINDVKQIDDYPSKMEDFKDIGDYSLNDLSNFFDELIETLGALMEI